MPLPNPSMSFSPFAILTAEEMNDLVENIESLADGTGFDAGAIGPASRSGGLYSIVHTFTDATGSQSITGVPFAPRKIGVISQRTTSPSSGNGVAVWNGSATQQSSTAVSGSQNTIVSTVSAFLVSSNASSSELFRASVTAWNSGGISVNVNTTNSTVSVRTFSITFEA